MRLASASVAVVQALLLLCLTTDMGRAEQCQRWSSYTCSEPTTPKAQKRHPEQLELGIIPPRDAVLPDVRKLYRVDVKCNSVQRLPSARQGIFSRTDVVTSHFIAVTDQALTGSALPTQARALIPVYAVSTANANQGDFTNKACNTSFFISGRTPLFITATANQTQTTTPSALINLFFSGLKVVNPVWPLFAGSEAAALLKPRIDGIAATETPLSQLFSRYDTSGTQTYSAPVYVKEQNIRTNYSRTTVTVEEVPSIVKTGNGRFIVVFEDALKGYSDEVRTPTSDVNVVAAQCRSYDGQLQSQNFPGYDIAYALSYVTRTAGLDRTKSIACLGKEYGLLSVESFTCPPPGKALRCLWNRFSNPLKVDDFTDPYPIQIYKTAFFKQLRNAMDDYAAASPEIGNDTRAELAKYFEDDVEFEDLDRLVKGTEGKISAVDFMRQLVESGFTKFGCPTKDNQAAGLLFGFPSAPGPDGAYQENTLVALRNWTGNSGKVFKVEAFFQPGLASDVAKPTLMWCGSGLRLQKQDVDANSRGQ